MADVFPAAVSEEVVFRRSFIYQSQTKPVLVPAPFTFFNMVQGDTGLRFQKTIIYQISAEAASPETHVFWDHPWAEPVRRKRNVGLLSEFGWSTFAPPIPVISAVLTHTYSSGVTFQRSFIYQAQARPAFTPPPEVVTVDKWYQWLSEPKRFKRGLRADEQQFVAASPVFPNFFRIIPWWEPLAEPVRLKKGMRAWLQQAFTTSQNKPVANPVFFSLNAVEINLDTALFGIAVGEEPVPVGAASASVTVVEIPAISGASASIQET